MSGEPPGGYAAGASPTLPERAELGEAPPFLSWNGLYGLVVGALVVEILLFSALTFFYR